MPLEVVEVPGPQASIWRKPLVHRPQRLGANAVEPLLGLRPHINQAGLSQHAQVLRHRRLAQLELADELAHGALAGTEEVENASAVRLSDDLERGHAI